MRFYIVLLVALLGLSSLSGCSEEAEAAHRARRQPAGVISSAPASDSGLYDADGGGLDADGGGADAVAPSMAVLVQGYGQSNMLITTATPILSTTRPSFCPSLAWTNTALQSLQENVVNTGAVESPASGFGWALDYYEGVGSATVARTLAVDIGAVGSQSMAQLAQGTANYTSLATELGEMYSAFATARPSMSYRIGPMIFDQGEQDEFAGTTEANYVTNANGLLDMQSDYLGTVNAAPTPDTTYTLLPVIFAQIGNWSHGSVGLAGAGFQTAIAAYQYRAYRDNPTRLILSHPTYMLPYQGNQHFTNVGSRRSGEYFSRAYISWLANPDLPSAWFGPLRPNNNAITCNGTTITVPIIGGNGSSNLTVDTSSVVRKYMGGWSVRCPSQATWPTVTATSASGRTMTLTLNRSCTSDCLVEYAEYAIPRVGAGPTISGAAGGNFRNAYLTRAYNEAVTLPDWLVAFEEDIDTCTSCGEAAETTYVAGQGSYRASSTGTSFISCDGRALGTAINGSANVSICFRVRYDGTWPTGTSSILGRLPGSRTQFEFRSSATLGRAMRFYVAANTNDFGTYFQTAVNTFNNSTWHHVCGTFDGSQATNLLTTRLYVDGVDVSTLGTYTGTMPDTFTTVTTDLGIGGSAEAGGNAGLWNIQDIAIWPTTTLSAADVVDLAGAVTSPIGDIGTDPTFFIPLHPHTLEVQGTGSSMHCAMYGTGNTWQASSP